LAWDRGDAVRWVQGGGHGAGGRGDGAGEVVHGSRCRRRGTGDKVRVLRGDGLGAGGWDDGVGGVGQGPWCGRCGAGDEVRWAWGGSYGALGMFDDAGGVGQARGAEGVGQVMKCVGRGTVATVRGARVALLRGWAGSMVWKAWDRECSVLVAG
jgi:hypothetical protein